MQRIAAEPAKGLSSNGCESSQRGTRSHTPGTSRQTFKTKVYFLVNRQQVNSTDGNCRLPNERGPAPTPCTPPPPHHPPCEPRSTRARNLLSISHLSLSHLQHPRMTCPCRQTDSPHPHRSPPSSCHHRLTSQNPGPGCRVQSSGCRVQGAGFRVQGPGFFLSSSSDFSSSSWSRVQGSGYRVQGAG